MTSWISPPWYQDEKAAYQHLEEVIWPYGPVCPHCGNKEKNYALNGEKTRIGLKKCCKCRKQFTVKVGTVFESSHVPLYKWLLAVHLLSSSKKGMSAHQLHRLLDVTYKTAWFMSHRIREAMGNSPSTIIGGKGKSVQMDETYFGTKDAFRGKSWPEKKGHSKKMSVVGLVSEGRSRMFQVDSANTKVIYEILADNVHKDTELHTDESRLYMKAGKKFSKHKTVRHAAGQWVRDGAHTNNIENYFSIFKRGMRGVYQHCSEKHLQRYLNEFDFRYNTRDQLDVVRAHKALRQIVGRRMLYKSKSL